MNANELLEHARNRLRECADRFDHPGLESEDANLLLLEAMGRDVEADEEIPAPARRRFNLMLERRAAGEPLPYIVGWAEFRDFRLAVRPGGFIPRATTEFLAEEAIRRIRRRRVPTAVDVATGIGPVALSIAREVPHATVYGTDLGESAVRQARANARALGLSNARFVLGSLFDPLPRRLRGAIDVITSHPPYVARHEVRELPPEIRDFEPVMSLTDRSPNGLGLAHRIVHEGREWLRPGGWVLIEIGSYLARAIRSDMLRAGYRDVRSRAGEWRYTRVIAGKR